MGLGQPLKSFRDAPTPFPPYAPGASKADSLAKLGALRIPEKMKRGTRQEQPTSPADAIAESSRSRQWR